MFTVTAGSVSVTNLGAGCSTPTNAAQCDVGIKPNQPIQLKITGSNVYSVNVELLVPGCMDLRRPLTRNRRPTTPASFRLYVDGVEGTNIIADIGTNSCGAYEKSWTIELRPDKDAPRRNSPQVNDGTAVREAEAPGDADWPEIGPGKSTSPGVTAIKWDVGLGRLYSGMSAGRILYAERGLNSNSYTPNSLFFYQPFTNHSQVIVLTNWAITNMPVIRQIKAPQAFVDIPSNTTNSFELRFYPLSHVSTNTNSVTGYYDILTNSPFVLWRFSNPDQDPSITKRLRITEARPGITYTNDIEYNSTNQTWSLIRGAGPEQYRETRGIYVQYIYETNELEGTVVTNVNRFETNKVTDGASKLAYEAVENYELFSWGWELISVVVDPATNVLTTTFAYHHPTNSAPADARKLASINYPDGSWENRSYAIAVIANGPALLSSVGRPYKDGETTVYTSYTYQSVSETGEIFLYSTERRTTNAELYRYDTTKKSYAQTNVVRETYQVGWLPSCMGARVRDGVLRYLETAPPEACGQTALTLTNYILGVTNIYEFGIWSNSTFYVGAGNDWRKTSVHGLGSILDGDDPDNPTDRVQTIPGKSIKRTEIRKGGVPVCAEFYGYTDTVTNGTNFTLMFRDFFTNDVLGHATYQRRVDAVSARELVLRTADWQGTNQFPGQLLLSEADEDGAAMRYTYDSLKRLKSKTLSGTNGLPDFVVSFTYDACDRVLSITTNAGTLTLSNSLAYDLSGRLTKTTDPIGLVTTFIYPSNGLITKITYSSGATLEQMRFLSGEPKNEMGTAIVPRYFDHAYIGVDPDLDLAYQKHTNALRRESRLAFPGSDRLKITLYNMWESPIAEMIPGPAGFWTNRYFYANHDEDLTSTESPSTTVGSPIQYYYARDCEHHAYASWLYVNGALGHTERNLAPLELSNDRLVRTLAYYTNISGAWFRVTNSYAYLTDSSATATLISSVRQRLNGFGTGVKSEMTAIDVNSNSVVQTISVDRNARKVTQVITSSASSLSATSIVINGLLQSQSTVTVAAPTLYYYDALRRAIRVVSPVGAAITTTYDAANGRVTATTDFAGNTTSYAYYGNSHTNAGRISCVTAANGKKTYYGYNFRGDTVRIWGDVPYPEERILR